MRDVVQSLLAGGGIGAVFALLKQPMPAPPTLAGVMGIVGLTVGYWLVASR